MPEVKMFVNLDLPLYHNVPFKHIGGADPFLLLLDKDGFVIERTALKHMKRHEINDLMDSLGFYKKENKEDEVPEEFREGPYLPKKAKSEEAAEEQSPDAAGEKEEL